MTSLPAPLANALKGWSPQKLAVVNQLLTSPRFAPTLALCESSGWSRFRPRRDDPRMDDWQSSFYNSRDAMAFFLKGNAAGGTTAGAAKLAKFVLHDQPPPRPDTPFWIIGNTLEQCCETIWKEKLLGEGHLPQIEVDWPKISWIDAKRQWPRVVPLKPWPGQPAHNWCLEFKSHEQGRASMQARSIGGFWFSEQFPYELLLEVFRACRNYSFPGGQWAEFTPIEPDLCVWMQTIIDAPPPGWKIYWGNTEANKPNLAPDWYEQFAAAVPDEMAATRLRGKLAGFEGSIYQSFRVGVHVRPNTEFAFPPGITHFRGIDWGASEAHPQCCVWGYRDGLGTWWIYDEYMCGDQTRITMDHAVEILARSIAWGWPRPIQLSWTQPVYQHLAEAVDRRLEELGQFRRCHVGAAGELLEQFGYTFADPSRPGEIAEFSRYGILTAPAANDVYQGINCVRGYLKVNPFNDQPRLWVAERCENLVRQIQKYRWKPMPRWKEGEYVPHAVPPPQPLKKDDDLPDAARYMVYTESLGLGDVPGSTSDKALATPRESVQLEQRGSWREAFGRHRQ